MYDRRAIAAPCPELATPARFASTSSGMRTALSSSSLVATMLAGCSREPESKPARSTAPVEKTAAGWPAFVDSFIEARFKADPYFAVQAGATSSTARCRTGAAPRSMPKSPSCANSQGELAKCDPAIADRRRSASNMNISSGWWTRSSSGWRAQKRRSQSGLVPRKARSFDVPDARIRAVAETARGLPGLRARRAGARRQHPRQSAHAVAEGLHRTWRGGLRRLRHVLPRRDAGHLRAACRREAETRTRRGHRSGRHRDG